MTSYQLIISLRSPFARRVRLALLQLGIPFKEQIVNVFEPPKDLFEKNPLGLIPALEVEPGKWISDSAAILEFLNEKHGGIWPKDLSARVDARQASTLAEGVMTMIVSHYLDKTKGGVPQDWLEDYLATIRRTLLKIDSEGGDRPLWNPTGQPGRDLAIALEYLSLRIPELNWRNEYPGLAKFFEKASQAPHFKETSPPA